MNTETVYFDSGNLATYVSTLGSTFEATLDTPISFPKNSNPTVELRTAEIWNVFPNITTGVNDLFRVEDDGTDSGTAKSATIVIPQGTYETATLNNKIQLFMEEEGFAANIISLSPDNSTGKVLLTFNNTGVTVNFTIAQTFRVLLGFDSQNITSIVKPQYNFGDSVAKFNTINSLFIKTDIVDNGIPLNGKYSHILSKVPITARVGSQINYEPRNPAIDNCRKLINNHRLTYTFRLTDQTGALVNTNGEQWGISLLFKWRDIFNK